jgi:hypothetical protein
MRKSVGQAPTAEEQTQQKPCRTSSDEKLQTAPRDTFHTRISRGHWPRSDVTKVRHDLQGHTKQTPPKAYKCQKMNVTKYLFTQY